MVGQEKKAYWYKVYIYMCPLCGKETIYRERQYTQKPESPEERVVYKEVFDYCNL